MSSTSDWGRLRLTGRDSPNAQRLICLAAESWSYDISLQRLAKFCGLNVSDTTIRELSQQHGAQANAWLRTPPERQRCPLAGQPSQPHGRPVQPALHPTMAYLLVNPNKKQHSRNSLLHPYQSLLDTGKFESWAALVRFLGVSGARVTQVLRGLHPTTERSPHAEKEGAR